MKPKKKKKKKLEFYDSNGNSITFGETLKIDRRLGKYQPNRIVNYTHKPKNMFLYTESIYKGHNKN